LGPKGEGYPMLWHRDARPSPSRRARRST